MSSTLKLHSLILFTLLLIGYLLVFSENSLAHVMWFASEEETPLTYYTFSNPEVVIFMTVAVIVVLISIFLEYYLPTVILVGEVGEKIVFTIFSILVGISLLASSHNNVIIAHHYHVADNFTMLLQYLAAGIGALLIFQRFIFAAAILLLLLYLGMEYSFGVVESCNYINFVGIALFLMFNSLPYNCCQRNLQPYALFFLRVFTGAALIFLAMSEKLLRPEWGMAFLKEYHWNFMAHMGFNYPDSLFVLSAGFVELTLGIIFIIGTVTRINTLVLASLMVTSNIMFLLEKNYSDALIEIIGHLPILATAIVLITLGTGHQFSSQFEIGYKRSYGKNTAKWIDILTARIKRNTPYTTKLRFQ
jgi:uncharacterized membrane protein YphA (DoxX/SURF4 family)